MLLDLPDLAETSVADYNVVYVVTCNTLEILLEKQHVVPIFFSVLNFVNFRRKTNEVHSFRLRVYSTKDGERCSKVGVMDSGI